MDDVYIVGLGPVRPERDRAVAMGAQSSVRIDEGLRVAPPLVVGEGIPIWPRVQHPYDDDVSTDGRRERDSGRRVPLAPEQRGSTLAIRTRLPRWAGRRHVAARDLHCPIERRARIALRVWIGALGIDELIACCVEGARG